MAFPTIATASNAFRVPAAIQYIYIRPSGELYQTLGALKNAEIVFDDYEQTDSLGKNKVIQAMTVTAKATMMQASVTEIELLDTLVAGTSSFLFKMADAAAIPTVAAVTEGWFLLSSTQIGVKYKIVASGDTENQMEIQLEFAGSLQYSAVDAAIKASIDDNEFEATGGSGTFKAIGTYTAALNGGLPTSTSIKSCGISALTLADTAGAAQTLGPIDDPVIEFEAMAEQDSLKVFRTRWVNVNINYKWKQTDAVNLLNLNAFSDSEIDVVVTMANGIVMTLTNQTGIAARLESVGDFEGTRSIIFRHTGKLLPSAIDGIFA